MKRGYKPFIGIFLSLVILVLIIPANLVGAATITTSNDIDTARHAGQEFISDTVHIYPEWLGASLSNGQEFINLQGQIIAYLFAIQKQNITVGRIVVGSKLYNYEVFEAGNAPIPTIPNSIELESVVARDVGIKIGAANVGTPQLAYIGYNSYLAIYNINGRSIAFDMQNRRAAPTSKFKTSIISPAKYKTIQGGIQPLSSADLMQLPVPLESQWDSQIPPSQQSTGCGPTSGAMIGEYYASSYPWYYSNFYSWPTDFFTLYNTMGTATGTAPWNTGTAPWNAGPGFSTYAAQLVPSGYNFYNSYNGISDTMSTYYYDQLETYIQDANPFMVLFWAGSPYATWHYCAVIGYYVDYSDDQYMIINDPGLDSTQTISWDANYGWITLHWLKPQ